ncbi:hepatocyte growth factor activator isoform X1 [Triplophysa dalaica]|uniref:hepatocyte growth factor activator isoform X1 n=1 Tax=Triplophysa dalaica TaxID=1582913 RepID=UPI0024E022B2|nr:hepatocyte growth factor activator isoform X1 [Triplophysa dalaica]
MWRTIRPEMRSWDCLMIFLLSYFILLPCLQCAGSRRKPPGIDLFVFGESNSSIQKVLTTDGRQCKFPFRLGGTIYHQCIPLNSKSKTWCSLTHNFDRDRQWGVCSPRTRLFNRFLPIHRDPGICRSNPCYNGGVCVAVDLQSFDCVCPDGFSGALCDNKNCYEPLHLKYYDIGESWGRIYMRNVELCTCLSGGITCERTRYTACLRNSCANDGVCRMIEATSEEVCGCTSGYIGQYCNINPIEQCYRDSGELYRGIANTTVSGLSCLPWNSDLLFDELTVDTVDSAPLRGLGAHSFCRSPDRDKLPWCYTMRGRYISWEYCDVPRCSKRPSTRRGPVVPNPPRPSRSPSRTPVCGKRHEKRVIQGRIMGGTSALPGAHPWMAALYIEDEFCAGTLVSSCWIVSAAHCFLRKYVPLLSKIRVVLGQHSFNDTGPNTRRFGVEKYILHPRYTQYQPTLNDIVLVKLKKANGRCAQKTQFIRPICVPVKDMTFPDNTCCKISGWGHMHEKANSYSNLMEGVVKVIPFERCSSPEMYGSEIRPGMMCAGSDSCVDACQGDSGGPLACQCEGVNFLYGIISWGDGCGRTGKPGVYTLVPKYSDWINSIIKSSKKNKPQNRSANTIVCSGNDC